MFFDRFREYVFKPHRAFLVLLNAIKFEINYFRVLYRGKAHGIETNLGNGVKFYQETIVSGKGSIQIGENTFFGVAKGGGYRYNVTELQPRYKGSKIIIGKNVAINNSSFICAANKIEIMDNCLIGRNVSITDFEAHGTSPDERNELGRIGEVIISKNVWIGNNVTILKNVTIGKDSIISTGSVVFKGNYPPKCIIGGNPAKVVKFID